MVRLLEAQGIKAYAEPQATRRRGSLHYEGTVQGLCKTVERVYSVGYYQRGGKVYFGGEPRAEWVRLPLGGEEADRVKRELKHLLPRGSEVAVLGEEVIVSTSPGNARALEDTSLVSGRDYSVRAWLVSVDRSWWAGLEGGLDVNVSGDFASAVDWSAVVDLSLTGGTRDVRCVDAMSVRVPGGMWGEMRVTTDRFFEVFTVEGESGERLRSEFDRREAGLRLRVLVRRQRDGHGLRYELEKSRFANGDSKRVSELSGSVRASVGEPVLVGRVRQTDTTDKVTLLDGSRRERIDRDLLLIVRID